MQVLEFTEVDMQEAYVMSWMILFVQKIKVMISFVQKMKGWIERIDEDALWDCLSFVVMLEGGGMHGAQWMGVGNDKMVVMFSLHSIYSYHLSS